MANMDYRRPYQQTQSGSNDPGWALFCAIIAVVLCLAALPWIILGCIAQRIITRWLPWKLRLLLWLALCLACALLLYQSYQHGLESRLQQEITAYVVAVKHSQSDLAAYPLRQLWAETWPVWMQSWQSIGIAGCAAELWSNKANTNTARTLRQNERKRERRVQRIQQRARKRTSIPAALPDAIGEDMVIGVPINDDNEEDSTWGI